MGVIHVSLHFGSKGRRLTRFFKDHEILPHLAPSYRTLRAIEESRCSPRWKAAVRDMHEDEGTLTVAVQLRAHLVGNCGEHQVTRLVVPRLFPDAPVEPSDSPGDCSTAWRRVPLRDLWESSHAFAVEV